VICVSGLVLLEYVCNTTGWTVASRLWRTTINATNVSSALVAITLPTASLPIGTGLLKSYLDLSTRVSVANILGDEGAKALGDALKDNPTLSSLSLSLQGE
jgi:TRAP-type C4-dicarboxylate transport system permease small subunit